jgi:Na+/proline symporter
VSYVIFVIGILVVLYTTSGGTRAVSWAQSYQMAIITLGMVSVGFLVVWSLPHDISFSDVLHVAAFSGKFNAIDFTFDLNNKYTFWSGLLGGLFLQLSYFGTDQSQVQRYLSGESVTQSRLGLLFNGMMKIPMQFGILFIGAMMFVFYQFSTPPIFFNQSETAKLVGTHYEAEFNHLSGEYEQESAKRATALRTYTQAVRTGDNASKEAASAHLAASAQTLTMLKGKVRTLLEKNDPKAVTNDTNYIFLTFVIHHLPVGLVGLLIAVVFSASMSSAASEINALASTTVVDIYKRLFQGSLTEVRSVWVTRVATVAWGAIIVGFAQFMGSLGSLIEAVNKVGSLFYGAILGIFLAAFYLKRMSGTAVFVAALLTEVVIFCLNTFTEVGFLWYNLIGCVLVLVLALAVSPFFPFVPKNEQSPAEK